MSYIPPDLGTLDFSARSQSYTPPDLNSLDLTGAPPDPGVSGSGADHLAFTAQGSGIAAPAASGVADLGLVWTGSGAIGAAGSGLALLSMDSAGEASVVREGAGSIVLAIATAGTGYTDWVATASLHELQEYHGLVVTGSADGLDDLPLKIETWQATAQRGERRTYLQATVPATLEILNGIEARQSGELVIRKGYRFSDGMLRTEEILRTSFDDLRYDRGPGSFTVTVSGYQDGLTEESGVRQLRGVRSLSVTQGLHRARCDIDLFLRPGMTAVVDGIEFPVSYINYYVGQRDRFCEVSERNG